MGKFRQFLTGLSARDTFVFKFHDSILKKSQCFFTKFYRCIDFVEIWFEIANGQISSIFDRVTCPRHDNGGVLSFLVLFQCVTETKKQEKKTDFYFLWKH